MRQTISECSTVLKCNLTRAAYQK